MRLLVYVLSFLVVTVFGYMAASYFLPQRVSNLLLTGLYWASGVEKKQLQTAIGPINYLEGGSVKNSGETIVFVHGLFARKETWLHMASAFSSKYHIVLIDLPGFGDNPLLPDTEYTYQNQLKNLTVVLDRLNVEQAHIAASSMGGQLAGMLAVQQPARVLSLAFIGSPAGVPTPQPSDAENYLKQTGNWPILAGNQAQYKARNDFLLYKEPFTPAAIENTWMALELNRADNHKRILELVASQFTEEKPLLQIAGDIKQPVHIQWCQQDRIFHPSGAKLLNDALPRSQLIMLQECGHLPMLDKAEDSAASYMGFLANLKNTTHK
ncbi:alpha/beta fold hydrolase [Polycladidibacter stylochi]|uniref:alpha/beta fold hydrolase n=1 Tax=Polycladidibacter stylochi TaxID=1807766 RepID=UPI00082B65A2|nr:alpha/beta hydrolase [Pseudovibrio stylochi]